MDINTFPNTVLYNQLKIYILKHNISSIDDIKEKLLLIFNINIISINN